MLAHHNAGGIAVNDFVAARAEAVVAAIEALGVPAIAVPRGCRRPLVRFEQPLTQPRRRWPDRAAGQ